MQTKANFILKIFLLFLALTCSSFWGFSQELYYWSNGRKVKLVEDKSSMVVYEKESQKLKLISSVETKEIIDLSDKVLGNYKIVKFSDKTTLAANAFEESSIKSKKYGLINEKGDSIYLSNVILLKLKSSYEYNDLSTIIEQYNARYISTDYNVIKIYVENISNVLSVANEIYESGKVEWCHPDFLVNMKRNFEPRDKQYYIHNKYHYCGAFGNDINIVRAWEISQGCANIIVAVIDDGVEDHPALRDGSGNSRVLPGFTPSGTTVNGRPGTGDAHGQCCAGIIAASHSTEVRGVAPNVMILPVKIRFGYGIPSSEYADAINWAWNNGNADVLSNSWGPGDYDVVRTAINNAQTLGRGGLGSIVAFSSGNDGANEVNAAAKVSIAVGAINKYDTPAERLKLLTNKRYTNIGSDLDLVAYGGDVDADIWTPIEGDIRTIDRTGNNGYESGDYTDHFSGTSAACPQVSGAAALVLSVNPNLTRTEVENILFTTATDLGSAGKDNTYGYGKLNVYAALLEAIKTRNERFELSNGYLTYSKFRDNFKMSFVGTPGCGIASGIYWCDVYKAEASIPYSNVFLYEGDGLSGANPNSGEYYVNVTNNGSTLDILTFFYFVRTNSIGQTVNKWVPFDPSSSWTRKYSVSPPTNVVFNGTVASGQSKEIYATNTIRLTTGCNAVNGSYFRAAKVAPSGSISCLPNPTVTTILKSANLENDLILDEKALINEGIQTEERLLTIYPNPSDGNFYIKLANEISPDARIEIFDIGGKIVYKTALYSSEQNIIFTDKPGYYIIKVFNGQDYYTDKLLLK